MQKLFVETKYEGDLELPVNLVQKLPQKIVLAMPVQFLDFQEKIKKQLISAGKEVTLFRSLHGKYPGQILGCDTFEFKNEGAEEKKLNPQKAKLKDFDAFLYIGDGKFHPTALLYYNKKKVFCYNPFTEKVEVLAEDYLQKLEQKKKGQLSKFLSSKNIGIIMSSKPGQNQTRKAEELREKLEKKDKEAYLFLTDEINFNQLPNFNFIQVWINTACPRLIEDFGCLNLEDLSLLESK